MTEEVLALREQLAARGPWLRSAALFGGFRRIRRAAVVVVPVTATFAFSGVTAQTIVTIAAVSAVWFVVLGGAYTARGPSPLALGDSVITLVRTLTGVAFLSLLDFWVPRLELSSGELLVMGAGVFLMSWLFDAKLRSRAESRRLVLVGSDDGTRELLEELGRNPQLPFEVLGIVDDEDSGKIDGVKRLGRPVELGAILREERPDLVVLGNGAYVEAMSHLLDLASLDVRVVNVHHFNEHAFGRVPVHHLSPEWFVGVLHLYQRPYSRIAKRTFDVAVASVALLLAAPVMLAVSLAIRRSSAGPVFFHQRRLGEAGKLFEIRKFRTMIEQAEEAGVAVWASAHDARVTRIGRVLRRTRLDELPQLWNVLRGDMSIVGPRPERPEFMDLLRETVPFWTRRHLVKPGITGWAQVRRGYTDDVGGTADKLSYDLYYLKYRSLLFDVAIAARTVRIVLTGFGSR